jgi:ubiquinone biosynthesis protein UbiJ
MPLRQLAAALLEQGSNTLLKLDPEHVHLLKPLTGKSLQLVLTPIQWPLVLYFSDTQIDISLPEQQLEEDAVDCSVIVALSALDQIRDTNNLTKLIKADKLDLQGDLKVLQNLSGLLSALDLDLEKILTTYLGHTPAQYTLAFAEKAKTIGEYWLDQAQVTLAEALVEEKKLVASSMRIALYCEDVTQVRYQADRVEARIALLEKQAEQHAEKQ